MLPTDLWLPKIPLHVPLPLLRPATPIKRKHQLITNRYHSSPPCNRLPSLLRLPLSPLPSCLPPCQPQIQSHSFVLGPKNSDDMPGEHAFGVGKAALSHLLDVWSASQHSIIQVLHPIQQLEQWWEPIIGRRCDGADKKEENGDDVAISRGPAVKAQGDWD